MCQTSFKKFKSLSNSRKQQQDLQAHHQSNHHLHHCHRHSADCHRQVHVTATLPTAASAPHQIENYSTRQRAMWTVFGLLLVFIMLTTICTNCPSQVDAARTRSGRVLTVAEASGRRHCPEELHEMAAACFMTTQNIGNYSFVPPRTNDDMINLCTRMKDAIACGHQYTKECLRDIPAQMMTMLLRNVKKMHRTRCQSKRERREYRKQMQCFQPSRAKPLHDCVASNVMKLQWLANVKNITGDELLPAICCTIYGSDECIRTVTVEVCKGTSQNPQETAEYMSDMLTELTGDAVDLLCGKYSNIGQCRAQLPNVMARFDELDEYIASPSYTPPRVVSIALPLVDLFSRLETQT